jgi:hypothetical protein
MNDHGFGFQGSLKSTGADEATDLTIEGNGMVGT